MKVKNFYKYTIGNNNLGFFVPNLNDDLSDEFQLINLSMSKIMKSERISDEFEVFRFKQVHGADVAIIKDGRITLRGEEKEFSYSLSGELEGDAFILFDNGKLVGIRAADCAPLMFFSPYALGGMHCGWRGLKGGIITKTLETLKNNLRLRSLNDLSFNDLSFNDFVFFIMPCIHVCCYEVGREFLEWAKDSCYVKGDKVFFDIPKFINDELMKLGISEDNIFYSPLCTSCSSPTLPSYRATKTEERMISFVWRD